MSFHLLCLEKASKHSRKREFDPWIGEEPLEEGTAPTPVFLLGKSHGQRSLAGYSPWVTKSRTQLCE